MVILNTFLLPCYSPASDFERDKDPENSSLLKIAACIPGIGLVICKTQSASLEKKLKQLSLPKKFRPHPTMGNVLDENATPEERKAACQRAAQLASINRDYTKAALVNNILTIALVVFALANNMIPFIVGGLVIGGFCLTSSVFAFTLYNDRSQAYSIKHDWTN